MLLTIASSPLLLCEKMIRDTKHFPLFYLDIYVHHTNEFHHLNMLR